MQEMLENSLLLMSQCSRSWKWAEHNPEAKALTSSFMRKFILEKVMQGY